VLLAGVAGFRNVGHNASASLLKRWVFDNTFTWLISEQILDEYKEVLASEGTPRIERWNHLHSSRLSPLDPGQRPDC